MSETDLISLHCDHAPDKDDGQSAAADRTVLESLYGRGWLTTHTVAISGTYGLNRNQFNPASDRVMDVAFNEVGGWISAHRRWDIAVQEVAKRSATGFCRPQRDDQSITTILAALEDLLPPR